MYNLIVETSQKLSTTTTTTIIARPSLLTATTTYCIPRQSNYSYFSLTSTPRFQLQRQLFCKTTSVNSSLRPAIASNKKSSLEYCCPVAGIRSPRARNTAVLSMSQQRRNSSNGASSSKPKPASKEPSIPRPSSSVLLISPQNHILLLHRVQTSSAFPSAHVFPGGNVSKFHDGDPPPVSDLKRHEDSRVYRLAAIRETFEESGVLLARNNGFGRLIEVEDEMREQGRRDIHAEKVEFETWLARQGGRADVDGLIPFTRWVTPTNVPKRFTTQMYIYFLPLANSSHDHTSNGDSDRNSAALDENTPSKAARDAVIPKPTHDGGIEHTEARYLPAWKWIEMAQSGEIILFPPQLFLLHLIAPYLAPRDSSGQSSSSGGLQQQRQRLQNFLKSDTDPSWAEKVISPSRITQRKSDKRIVLGLHNPGPELRNSGRSGEKDRVVLVNFQKEGPRNVEVRWKKEVLQEERDFEDGAVKEKL